MIRTKTKLPEVKLSMTMPNGHRSSLHPFAWLLKFRWKKSKRALATAIGVQAQTIYGWENECAAHPRKFLLPAETTRRIADVIGVSPHFLRPDLWVKGSK